MDNRGYRWVHGEPCCTEQFRVTSLSSRDVAAQLLLVYLLPWQESCKWLPTVEITINLALPMLHQLGNLHEQWALYLSVQELLVWENLVWGYQDTVSVFTPGMITRLRVFSVPLPATCFTLVLERQTLAHWFSFWQFRRTDPYAGHFFLGCKWWSSPQLGHVFALFSLSF